MTEMTFDHCAAVVLHWAGQPGGYPPGSFVGKLLDAFGAADPENFALLTSAYPNLGGAMGIYKQMTDGIAVLQRMAADPTATAPEVRR